MLAIHANVELRAKNGLVDAKHIANDVKHIASHAKRIADDRKATYYFDVLAYYLT